MPTVGIRAGESGPLLVGAVLSITPASITAPNQNVAAAAADPRFIGATAVVATFGTVTPGANLLIGGAFVAPATGVVSVRFAAVGANYVSAAESIFCQRLN